MPDFHYQPMFELGDDSTPYRKLSEEGVSVSELDGQPILRVDGSALSDLAAEAVRDVSHLFRTSHLKQLAKILEDPEASDNDRFVAREMLKNANISAGMILPSCQDTGTAIVIGHKGENIWTTGVDDASAFLARASIDTYQRRRICATPRWRRSRSLRPRRTPAPICPPRWRSTPTPGDAYELPLPGQGRRLREQDLPLPGDARRCSTPDIA